MVALGAAAPCCLKPCGGSSGAARLAAAPTCSCRQLRTGTQRYHPCLPAHTTHIHRPSPPLQCGVGGGRQPPPDCGRRCRGAGRQLGPGPGARGRGGQVRAGLCGAGTLQHPILELVPGWVAATVCNEMQASRAWGTSPSLRPPLGKVQPSSAKLTRLHPPPRCRSYDADDEEEQSAALAAAAKGQQEGEKAAPAVVQAAAKAAPAASASPAPAQKTAVIAEAKKQEEEQQKAAKEAAAEAEEEAKQAARSGVVLGAAAAPAAKKAQPEIKISPQVGGWVGGRWRCGARRAILWCGDLCGCCACSACVLPWYAPSPTRPSHATLHAAGGGCGGRPD